LDRRSLVILKDRSYEDYPGCRNGADGRFLYVLFGIPKDWLGYRAGGEDAYTRLAHSHWEKSSPIDSTMYLCLA